MEEPITTREEKNGNGKLHLIGISIMILTAVVFFCALMNVFAIAERRDIMRQIESLHKDITESRVDKRDMAELKALLIRQHSQEAK